MVATIRPAADLDAQDLFGLITLCFAEYPGCFTDPHDDLPDLRSPGTSFAARRGAFWVIEDERGRVGACCGVDLPEDGMAEVHRLYVRPDLRKNGFAGRLLEKAETHAAEAGAARDDRLVRYEIHDSACFLREARLSPGRTAARLERYFRVTRIFLQKTADAS